LELFEELPILIKLTYTSEDAEEHVESGGIEEIRSTKSMRYAMIIEQGERNYSAYLPDLPGCIATGKTIEELKQRMSEAIELHLRGMREDGLPIPEPTSLAEYVEAA
jgi:predicted RNase H-like HicB family nuclease